MNPMARDTFSAINVNPISMELHETKGAVSRGEVVAGESAFPRIYPTGLNTCSKTVLDTGHSLFLTSIIVNEKWWNTLDSELQEIITESAVEAARMERHRSIEDGEDAKLRLADEGVEVISISPEEKEYFKQACEKVYEKYEDFFTPGLVNDIKLH
jgi:TRAP-type C4-dicarboxylate transport system substrate-binding protein